MGTRAWLDPRLLVPGDTTIVDGKLLLYTIVS